MSKPETKLISIDDLDSASANETPFEMPILNQKGIETGASILVIGGESQAFKDFISLRDAKQKKINADLKRRGKDEYVPTHEENIDFAIKYACVVTVGWKGLKEEFNAENVKKLYTNNMAIRNQVIKESSDETNFLLKV